MATQRPIQKAKSVRKAASPLTKPAKRTQQARRTHSTRIVTPASTAEDYEAVRQVLSRYCFALDRGQLEDLGRLFHRNADFSVSFENGTKHSGRETIQSWYQRFFQQRPDQYNHMRHKIYQSLLTVSGNVATASTYFDADSLEQGGKVSVVTGRYDDVLIKEEGQWFFKERTINVLYHYSPGSGQTGMRQ
ncbi:MAG: nuclear transport factor 2 family protein [Candidatus Binatia bacterium]